MIAPHPPTFSSRIQASRLPVVSGHPRSSGDAPDHNDGAIVTERKVETRRPSFYKVLLLNDDFTPMDFVTTVLEKFFSKTHSAAMEIMLSVHNEGVGVCGVFPHEIAETKVAMVTEYAREHEHPLQCTLEKA